MKDVREAAELILSTPCTGEAWASSPGTLIPAALACARAVKNANPVKPPDLTEDQLRYGYRPLDLELVKRRYSSMVAGVSMANSYSPVNYGDMYALVNEVERLRAEHPADDGEPVTEEWLRSVGFTERMEGRLGSGEFESAPGGRPSLSIWLDAGSVAGERVVYFDHEWEKGVYLPDQPTHGHVRRLCSALGIPLKETP